MIKNSIALTVAATVFMTGCSAMLPYRDNFQCEKGKNSGVCASVSEVYEMSFDMDELKKKRLNQEEEGCDGECGDKEVKKENIGKPIGNDTNTTENQRLKEIVEAIEIKKLQDGRPVVIQNNSSNIDNDTKRNIQKMVISQMASQAGAVAGAGVNKAVSSTASTMGKEAALNTTSIVDCSKVSGDDVIHTLNQDVKVCVYNANIRQKPSCTADILRVAKKGEVLYAEYEKNGWVKTDDGYIHKSIITKK